MVHTVGITGVNGNVGAAASKYLAEAAAEGKIKLVVFHREGNAPKHLSTNESVETRVLDFEDPIEKIEAAVKGVNVFISTVAASALPHEPKLVDALANSSDLITFIPSSYSTTWSAEDFQHPQLGPVMTFLHMGWQRAKEKNLGITAVYSGMFDNYYFQLGFLGSPLPGNTIWANEKQLGNPFPITAVDHLGAAIARIATADPHSIKGQSYSVITFWPTGQDLVDLYTKINGKQAQVKDFTRADREALLADEVNFGAPKVGYWDRWENASWEYESGGKISDREYDGPSLEEIARVFA